MKKLIAVLFFLITIFSLNAQESSSAKKTDFLQQLIGSWSGEGKAFGNAATISLVCKPSLENRFTQLSYKMLIHIPSQPDQVFEGVAYYKPDSAQQYVATWFDSGGDMHPIKSSVEGTTMTSLWGIPGKKYGKTVYHLKDNTSLEITDYIFRNSDQTWREFNRNTITRILQ